MKNFKVKCLKDNSFGSVTPGQIYSVINGKLIDDDGDKRPLASDTFNSVEDVCGWGGEFELVKESKMFTKDDIRQGDKIWTSNGHGIVIELNGKLLIRYEDGGWDYVKDDRHRTQKVIRPLAEYDLCVGQETNGEVVFDREKGIGCKPPVKEISVDEAARLLTEKFGQNVRIRVGE